MKFRMILPLFLCLAGIFMLIGCIYLPIPEHRVGDARNQDFRELVGDPNSRKPIRAQAISRDQIIKLLGPPKYRAKNDEAIGYTVYTETGFFVWVLCAESAERGVYAVKFVFDEHGLLKESKVEHRANRGMYPNNGDVERNLDEINALKKLNEDEPRLIIPGKNDP